MAPNDPGPRAYEADVLAGGRLAGVRTVLDRVRKIGFALTILLAVLVSPGLGAIIGMASLLLWALLGVSHALARAATRSRRATVAVEGDALGLTERGAQGRRVPLAALRSGWVVATENGGARMILHGRWGQRIVLTFDAADDARSLLRDLKLSARERPATFAFFFGLRVTVGADGVLMEWPLLRRRRFVPYSRIISTTSYVERIVLRLTDGGCYEIMTNTSQRSVALEQHAALAERIEDACAAYRASLGEPPLAALVRGERSALGWVKDLRALSETSGGGYRAATLPTDALWRVALDPAASEELRIGAGLALRGALDDEGRARLRDAAVASASPRVRVVLEDVVEGAPDEQLGEAIEARRSRR